MQLPAAVRELLPARRDLPLIALWLLGWLAFALAAAFAAAFSRFPADLWLTRRLQDIDAAAFIRAIDWAEDLTDFPGLIVVWILAVVALPLAARRWEALLLLAIMAAVPLQFGIKELVTRPAPSQELIRVTDDSTVFTFPSGHMVGAVTIYGFLLYLATVLIPQPALRLVVQLACLYFIAFTALERPFTGAHWPSDVLGGLLFGGLILVLFIWVYRRLLSTLGRRRRLPSA